MLSFLKCKYNTSWERREDLRLSARRAQAEDLQNILEVLTAWWWLDPEDLKNMSERTVRSAQIFIGALPILLVYPLLQKYFVKGMVLGSVKE